eukprot:1136240-Pelagomonas_calceolata.AAC.8
MSYKNDSMLCVVHSYAHLQRAPLPGSIWRQLPDPADCAGAKVLCTLQATNIWKDARAKH